MFKKKNQEKTEQSEIIDRYVTGLKKKEKERNKASGLKKRHMYNRRGPIIACAVLVFAVAAATAALFFLELPFLPDSLKLGKKASSFVVELPEREEEEVQYVTPDRPVKIFATTLYSDTDFSPTDGDDKQSELIENLSAKGLTTIFVSLNSNFSLLTEDETGLTYIKGLIDKAAEKNITVFALVDIYSLGDGNIIGAEAFDYLSAKMKNLAGIDGLGGIVLSGLENQSDSDSFKKYVSAGNFTGYKKYNEDGLTALVKTLSKAVKETNPRLYFSLVCDMVYQSTATSEDGMEATDASELLRDKNADVLLWLGKKYFDGVFVDIPVTTEDKKPSFKTAVEWWSENIPEHSDVGFVLSSDLAVKCEGNWNNPDQLTRQLMTLNTLNRYTFCFNSYFAMENDETEVSSVAYKYLSGGMEDDYVLTDLTITSPTQKTLNVYDNIISFVGASDPNFELKLNGAYVERTEYGYFSVTEQLKVGKNTFTFTHKGSSETYTVNYRYVVLKSYSPTAAVSIESGSTLIVKVTARTGSAVSATLGGQTVSLNKTQDEEGTEFSEYVGGFDLGEYEKDTSIGKILFKGTCNGVTESFKGGTVTVKAKPKPVSSVISDSISSIISSAITSENSSNVSSNNSSNSNNYIGVGNTLIAEVAKYQIETFNGDTLDDLSQPYNNYLPLGTVDYCSEKTSYDPSSGNTYRTLRYGKRVYTSKNGIAEINTLRGTLPSYNTVNAKSVTTEGRHTVLILDTYWKAPFTLTLSPQSYLGGTGTQRGQIDSAAFKYVDITFCYATQFDGNLSEIGNSPLFSKAEVIKGTSDYTLRLHLKTAGCFYGWTANYDSDGNLVFKFLNPAKAQAADNGYGGTLNGIVIVVDSGHGGTDGGASGSNPKYDEADRNLFLANQISTKLEALGATVVMTRTDDSSLTNDERILKVKNASPDLAVSVHRNAALSSSASGFDSYYFYPYTAFAAKKINNRMAAAGTYSSCDLGWHYFFLSRISDCPVVLTENGFMTNAADYNNMMSDSWNEKCADAIVKGIVDYFLEIG